MPQDELFRPRRNVKLVLELNSDPLQPEKPWRATMRITNDKGQVVIADSGLVPPVWEAEAFADACRGAATAFADSTAPVAQLRFKKALKEWRQAAEQLLTGGSR